MDIFDYLIRDHRKVAGLMDELLDINLQWVQQRIFEDIKAELILHAEAEEKIFYAALSAAALDAELDWQLDHSAHDHDDIRRFLDQLTAEGLTSPKWMMIFGELKYAVEHHVEEEEGRIFPLARPLITPPQAFRLGVEMDRVKQELRVERNIHTDHVANA